MPDFIQKYTAKTIAVYFCIRTNLGLYFCKYKFTTFTQNFPFNFVYTHKLLITNKIIPAITNVTAGIYRYFSITTVNHL